MLEGTRVVEFSTDVAGAFTGRLLALYGADVIVVEPPEGHPVRHLPPWPNGVQSPDDSVLFAYLGAGKRSVVLDLATAEGVAHARAEPLVDLGAEDEVGDARLVLERHEQSFRLLRRKRKLQHQLFETV